MAHEHPIHSMYFLVDCKLKISGPPTPTTLGEEGGVAEIPAGAAPIFPAMAHQVENVGDKEGKAIFIEPYPGCKPCGDIDGYISPFEVAAGCVAACSPTPPRSHPGVLHSACTFFSVRMGSRCSLGRSSSLAVYVRADATRSWRRMTTGSPA